MRVLGLLALLMLAVPAVQAADMPRPVDVIARGYVPGFDTRQQLIDHVIDVSGRAIGERWQLRAATNADAPAPKTAIVWEFHGLAYAGGAVRYIGPGDRNAVASLFGGHRPYSIEARLYVDGTYQTTLMRQPSIRGGARDPSLRDTIVAMTRELVASIETP